MDDRSPITIRGLYPQFTDGELEEAETNFRRYLTVVIAMAERLHLEGRSILDDLEPDRGADCDADLTVSATGATLPDERSNNP
jgi:hypothetical protein